MKYLAGVGLTFIAMAVMGWVLMSNLVDAYEASKAVEIADIQTNGTIEVATIKTTGAIQVARIEADAAVKAAQAEAESAVQSTAIEWTQRAGATKHVADRSLQEVLGARLIVLSGVVILTIALFLYMVLAGRFEGGM